MKFKIQNIDFQKPETIAIAQKIIKQEPIEISECLMNQAYFVDEDKRFHNPANQVISDTYHYHYLNEDKDNDKEDIFEFAIKFMLLSIFARHNIHFQKIIKKYKFKQMNFIGDEHIIQIVFENDECRMEFYLQILLNHDDIEILYYDEMDCFSDTEFICLPTDYLNNCNFKEIYNQIENHTLTFIKKIKRDINKCYRDFF